ELKCTEEYCQLRCLEKMSCANAKLYASTLRVRNIEVLLAGPRSGNYLNIFGYPDIFQSSDQLSARVKQNASLSIRVRSTNLEAFANGSISASRGTTVALSCTSLSACQSVKLFTTEAESTTLNCTTTGACTSALVYCPIVASLSKTASLCRVDCERDDQTCTGIGVVTMGGLSTVDLRCSASEIQCENAKLYCGNYLNRSCTLTKISNDAQSSYDCSECGKQWSSSYVPLRNAPAMNWFVSESHRKYDNRTVRCDGTSEQGCVFVCLETNCNFVAIHTGQVGTFLAYGSTIVTSSSVWLKHMQLNASLTQHVTLLATSSPRAFQYLNVIAPMQSLDIHCDQLQSCFGSVIQTVHNNNNNNNMSVTISCNHDWACAKALWHFEYAATVHLLCNDWSWACGNLTIYAPTSQTTSLLSHSTQIRCEHKDETTQPSCQNMHLYAAGLSQIDLTCVTANEAAFACSSSVLYYDTQCCHVLPSASCECGYICNSSDTCIYINELQTSSKSRIQVWVIVVIVLGCVIIASMIWCWFIKKKNSRTNDYRPPEAASEAEEMAIINGETPSVVKSGISPVLLEDSKSRSKSRSKSKSQNNDKDNGIDDSDSENLELHK
ncbi:hypothetical protein RFI_39627, partial [Reticulomyxa filosa]